MSTLDFLHKQIWRRLPRALRRGLLFYSTALVAPKPTVVANSSEPFIVVGTFRTASGLGASARLCHDALKTSDLVVKAIDITEEMMQPVELGDCEYADGRGETGPGTIIVHINSPLLPLAMFRLGRHLVKGKRIIGYWAWELAEVPFDWLHGVPFVHEIWVPSQFTARAVQPIARGRPVHVVPHPVAQKTALHIPKDELARERFTVLTIFNAASSFERKNPLAAIDAFRAAFAENPLAHLIIKASHLNTFPEIHRSLLAGMRNAPNITLLDEVVDSPGIDRLFSQSDVILSLHRSEGFGLVLAEAMTRGLPVIATNWSGNIDFTTPDTAFCVPYNLVPALDPQGTYDFPEMLWADPDIEAATRALQSLRNDRRLRQRLGAAGKAFADRNWSVEGYREHVAPLLGLSQRPRTGG